MAQEPQRLLVFDCSAAHCAVGLYEDGIAKASCVEAMRKGQAEALFPIIESALGSAGWAWLDLSALVVGTGPGNMTGLRIAIAAARGLALSLGIPALGVSRLEASAFVLEKPVQIGVLGIKDQLYLQNFGQDGALGDARLCRVGGMDGQDYQFAPDIATLLNDMAAWASAQNPFDHPRPKPLYVAAVNATPVPCDVQISRN